MESFKAVRLVGRREPLVEEQMPVPEVGPGETLVRVAAAGICHSDAHYWLGDPKLPPLPRTLGHEIAGVVAGVADDVTDISIGDRVGIHYQTSCGVCEYCLAGNDQFCTTGKMFGNSIDGGYAELVLAPARNLVPIPPGVELSHAAVMMCSSATVFHALERARLAAGEAVAVFGLGGLGQSAVQLAKARGAAQVFGVDLSSAKLELAERYGAIPIRGGDRASQEILSAGGVDVALELVGSHVTMRQAIDVLKPFGRAMAVGLASRPTEFTPFSDLIGREAEILGVADHLRTELPELLDIAAAGDLDLTGIVTSEIPLQAGPVNEAIKRLAEFGEGVRTVIRPDV